MPPRSLPQSMSRGLLSSRRTVLRGGLLGAAALGFARPARAAVPRSDLKFIFVRCFGGWDTTRVFSTELDNPAVAFEEAAERVDMGDLHFIHHPDRPSVTRFFETWASSSLILNGLMVPSVNHRACERIAYTGSNNETAADWATLLADAQASRYGLPHVVAGGRSLPGLLGRSVVRIGDQGQVGKLLDGSVLESSQIPVGRLPAALGERIDAHVHAAAAARQAAARDEREAKLALALEQSLVKSETMKNLGDAVRWNTDGTFESQVELAIDLLSLDLSRCVTLAFERESWDSHESNDDKQSDNFEDLFAALDAMIQGLHDSPGPRGGSLAEETVVVVMSEMGRTPHINAQKGKDHWAHTSALLIGPGITGGRSVGGFTDLFYGAPLDLDTGEIAEGGQELSPAVVGSTLLALGDAGPSDTLPEYSPLLGIFA
jgi:uncharacterized protein (DUF1501 family)